MRDKKAIVRFLNKKGYSSTITKTTIKIISKILFPQMKENFEGIYATFLEPFPQCSNSRRFPGPCDYEEENETTVIKCLKAGKYMKPGSRKFFVGNLQQMTLNNGRNNSMARLPPK